MKLLSFELQDDIFQATEDMLEKVDKPRDTYLSEAIDFYNKHQRRLWLKEQYAIEAKLIAESSMEVLREMENLDPHLLDVYEND